MTKIDQAWAQGIRDSVNALISEVERLESVGATLETENATLRQREAALREALVAIINKVTPVDTDAENSAFDIATDALAKFPAPAADTKQEDA